MHHGVILVGAAAAGKTAVWRVLKDAMLAVARDDAAAAAAAVAAAAADDDEKKDAGDDDAATITDGGGGGGGGVGGIVTYLVNPKAQCKEDLYGRLDPTTLEWTDGVFTQVSFFSCSSG
jgi:hypothetical protein